ncbi:MAG: hypothetical protein KME31_27445 [Tolypothrix carrinoi HA7290-LM1]|nr:hypothetical protein [Tolypothrix carrinoi HA7290-LM1]
MGETTAGASSRQSLSNALPPQDRAASPTHWLPNAQCPLPNAHYPVLPNFR